MKKIILISMMILALSLVFVGSGPAFAEEKLIKLSLAAMPEFETFFPWYAKQMGWDKEAGFDFDILYFESGMQELEALPAHQWQLGLCGGVPHIMGSLRYGTPLFGFGDDESFCNSVFARPSNVVVKEKGAVTGFPEVYGKAEDVRGKTFLVTTVSSAHYAMITYLKVFGLTDKDVVVKQMDQASIIAAFKAGIGDFACLWAPYSYKAFDDGWIEVSNVHNAGAAIPITFIGDKTFCEKNPGLVAKFLRVMFRGINKIADEGATEENIKLFQKMYKDWAGMEYTHSQAERDIKFHPVQRYPEQIKLFDTSKGESEAQRWERLIAEFLHANGKLTDEEVAKVSRGDWITDRYLKMVETPIPSYK